MSLVRATYSLACLVFSSAHTMPVHAADGCKHIVFAPGMHSTLVRGKARAEGIPVCYTLSARIGQRATLQLEDGAEQVVFKIPEPTLNQADEPLHTAIFTAKQTTYRVLVFRESPGSDAVSFSLLVRFE